MTDITTTTLPTITLQHRVSQHLFIGSWRRHRIGVVQFAKLMRRIHEAIRAEDPYAVLWRDQVQTAVTKARGMIQDWEAIYRQALADCRGIKKGCLTTPYTQEWPLSMTTAEGYQAACLVIDLDYLLSALVCCQRYGLCLSLISNPTALRHTAVQLVQKTLHVPLGWRATGITANALLANTPQAQQVTQKMHAVLSRPLPIDTLTLDNKDEQAQTPASLIATV